MAEDKKTRSQILQDQINQNKEELTLLKTSKDQHIHTVKDVFDCPECGSIYLEEAKKHIKPAKTESKVVASKPVKPEEKIKEVECLDCGKKVKINEPECPECHNEFF